MACAEDGARPRPRSGKGANHQEAETGDTNLTSTANAQFGGFGGLFKLTQSGPSADTGTLTLFFLGDKDHTGFDNLAFVTKTGLSAVEDAGATVHQQRNGLDSAFLFDTRVDHGAPSAPAPIRFIAEAATPRPRSTPASSASGAS